MTNPIAKLVQYKECVSVCSNSTDYAEFPAYRNCMSDCENPTSAKKVIDGYTQEKWPTCKAEDWKPVSLTFLYNDENCGGMGNFLLPNRDATITVTEDGAQVEFWPENDSQAIVTFDKNGFTKSNNDLVLKAIAALQCGIDIALIPCYSYITTDQTSAIQHNLDLIEGRIEGVFNASDGHVMGEVHVNPKCK